MKQTILYVAFLCIGANLSAQYAYDIIPFNASNIDQSGFIFSGVEVGVANEYLTEEREASLRKQYNIENEQIVSLLSSDDLYHLIIADSDRNSSAVYNSISQLNPSSKRVDIFRQGKGAIAANANNPVATTVASVSTTAAPATAVAKGVTKSEVAYRIQVAALSAPMTDKAIQEFTNKTGMPNLDSSYDDAKKLYKYYLPGTYPDYQSAKSSLGGLDASIKKYKPFVTKN